MLETHAHADHLTGADVIRSRTGAPVGIGEKITRVQKTFGDLFEAADVTPDAVVFDETYADGARFALGQLEVEVLHTPGHTPACVTYRIGDAAFVGDTLFMPDYGTARCDFPGGDARTLYRSIQKILALPEATRVFVGHDYLPEGRTDFRWETTRERGKGRQHPHRRPVGGRLRRPARGSRRDAEGAATDPAGASDQHPRRAPCRRPSRQADAS